jgi:hypothetical protein
MMIYFLQVQKRLLVFKLRINSEAPRFLRAGHYINGDNEPSALLELVKSYIRR